MIKRELQLHCRIFCILFWQIKQHKAHCALISPRTTPQTASARPKNYGAHIFCNYLRRHCRTSKCCRKLKTQGQQTACLVWPYMVLNLPSLPPPCSSSFRSCSSSSALNCFGLRRRTVRMRNKQNNCSYNCRRDCVCVCVYVCLRLSVCVCV